MTTTAPAPRLEVLTPSALAPHPNNPRRIVSVSVGDPLVASIQAQGVLEPLIAAPASDTMKVPGKAKYFVLAGHRRLAATKLAKVKTVPVIIRDDLVDLVAQVETMLVENIHREDLSPVEEGDAYQLLLDLDGLTQATLAAQVGQPRSRVRDRLKLAAAPEVVRDRLHDRQITIEQALKVAALEAEPDLLKTALDALGTVNEAYYLENTARRLNDRKDARKLVAACERDGGMTRLDDPPIYGQIARSGLRHQPPGFRYDGENPEKDHAPNGSCPNRAYHVHGAYGGDTLIPEDVWFACTEPLEHRVAIDSDATDSDQSGGGSGYAADDPAHRHVSTAEEDAARQKTEKRRQALQDAQAVRLKHVRSCLINPPKGAAQTLTLALAGDPESSYTVDATQTERYFQDALDPIDGYWKYQRRAAVLILDLNDTKEDNSNKEALRTAGWAAFRALPLEGQLIYLWWLATGGAEAEYQLTESGDVDPESSSRYVAALTDVLGYQWSTVEQELLGITEQGVIITDDEDGGDDE